MRLFLQGLDVLRTAEDFEYATAALASELAAQNVRYAEITTTPYNHHRRGSAMEEYVEGLDAGREAARRAGVEVGWICDIPRELDRPIPASPLISFTGRGAPEGVVGLGLGGPEPGFPPEMFASSFELAQASGLASIPHAGETAGPESVWGPIRALGADRIGHGVQAMRDLALVDHLVEHEIPLEISLSSNIALGIVASLTEHPIKELLAAEVPVTLNTDDPAYFSTTLDQELKVAHDVLGLSLKTLVWLQRTAITASYAPAAMKTALHRELSSAMTR